MIIKISLEEVGWSRNQQQMLTDAVIIMATKHAERRSGILNLLWDLVLHSANYVRLTVLIIFKAMVGTVLLCF